MCKYIHCPYGPGFRKGGCLLFLLGDHQHFFQLAQVGRRVHANVEEDSRPGRHPGDRADRQAFGEDAIAAAGQDSFAGRDLFV